MTELASPVVATMQILTASDVVAAAMGPTTRVHGAEIPKGRVANMPERCAVVAMAGAPPIAPGTADSVPVSVRRVDVRCYGRTPHEADTLALACIHALKRWRYGRTTGRVLVHWYHHAAGPVVFRDPEGDWPVAVVSFHVQMADELATA